MIWNRVIYTPVLWGFTIRCVMCDNKDEHSQYDDKETNSPDGNDVSVEKGFVTEDRDGASVKPELKRLPVCLYTDLMKNSQ